MAIVLGLNTQSPLGNHDSSATIVKNGRILAAIHEERISGIKHDEALPIDSIKECLRICNLTGKDIDAVAISWNSFTFRKPVTRAPFRYAMRKMTAIILKNLFDIRGDIYFVGHHKSHAASAYYTSGFKKCDILTLDGVGDVRSGAVWDINLQPRKSFRPEESLGFFYSIVTETLGFKHLDGEGKTMGFACYGKPNQYEKMLKIIPGLNLDQFHPREVNIQDKHNFASYRYLKHKLVPYFQKKFGLPRKKPKIEKMPENSPKLKKYADFAASAQKYLETRVLEIIDKYVNERNIALAGGVFLNCKLNQRIREKGFKVFIHPAAGDSGVQTGAALYVSRILDPKKFKPKKMQHTYYGTSYTTEEIEDAIKKFQLKYEELKDPAGTAADLINKGKVVGWFQGRMEYGPRALGNRSVLADPTDPETRNKINMFLKKRDWFMPFCPSILERAKEEYLVDPEEAPFMIMTFDVKPEKIKEIPSVVHSDNTVRPQTVRKNINPVYYRVIEQFEKYKVPLILNTSFNKHGLPMIMTPDHALFHLVWKCIDVLVIDNFLVERKFSS